VLSNCTCYAHARRHGQYYATNKGEKKRIDRKESDEEIVTTKGRKEPYDSSSEVL
jgi:hypothetical protein